MVGVQEYRMSTREEKMEVLKIWNEKGFQSRVKQRGEIKDTGNIKCPVAECSVSTPHKHYVDGDADVLGLLRHNATI